MKQYNSRRFLIHLFLGLAVAALGGIALNAASLGLPTEATAVIVAIATAAGAFLRKADAE